jgi:translation initiation factor 2 beta subunit (eIF-2beta)/eIF-5
MTTMNMNGSDIDTNYRYKMPIFKVTVAGKGNGVYTIFNNIDAISKSLNHPVEVIMKYLAAVSGSSYIQTRETITGPHEPAELKKFIMEYNTYLVFCADCGIPETIPSLSGNKKNPKLEFCCSACKHTTEAKSVNKRIEKGIDIIIKYLKAGGEWKVHKGTCVSQSTNSDTYDITQQSDNLDDIDKTNSSLAQTTGDEESNPFDFL